MAPEREAEEPETESEALDEDLEAGGLEEGEHDDGRPSLLRRAGGAVLHAGMGAMRRIVGAGAGPFQRGMASFYGRGDGFAGKTMANGKPMDPHAFTAAHKTLRLGTRIRVRRVQNGAEAIVTITDRGPYAKGRILDVSPAVSDHLGFTDEGHTLVELFRA